MKVWNRLRRNQSGEATNQPTTQSLVSTPNLTTEAQTLPLEKETVPTETTAKTERSPNDGDAYADFIERELVDLRAVTRSLEQRGLAVVSASGVLVALLFGFTAVAGGRAELNIPSSAHPWFYAGLVLFAVAAALGLLTNLPWRFQATQTAALELVLRDKWSDPPWMARRRIAVTRLKLYASYRRGNKEKGILLGVAILTELLALSVLAVGIGLVLANS
jgi:hypothetical protein